MLTKGQPVLQTESEECFADYLDDNRYRWEYEPIINGKRKHPDFRVSRDGHSLLCEVKERCPKGAMPRGGRNFVPYAGIREEIEEARRKFREYRNCCCALVIYNAGDWETRLDPEYVFAAMLGDLGFTMGFDPTRAVLLPEKSRTVFLPQRGKMMHYKDDTFQNKSISAILVLERRRLRNREFEGIVSEAVNAQEEALGRNLSADERATVSVEMHLSHKPKYESVVRVVVHENPGARIPFPITLFAGGHDGRYAIVGGRLSCVLQGIRIPELET